MQTFIKNLKKQVKKYKKWVDLRIVVKVTLLLLAVFFIVAVALGFFDSGYSSDVHDEYYGYNEYQTQQDAATYAEYDYEEERGFGGGFAPDVMPASMNNMSMAAPYAQDLRGDHDDMLYPTTPASKDAEDFETREYTARYEKRDIGTTCKRFEDLKPLEYVVFENANQNDTRCHYRFKVELEHEDGVLAMIEGLNPKYLDARTFTLERSITNHDNEVAILQTELEMLDVLLASAQSKYASLQTSGNAEALVLAINNEINLVERITNQKLAIQGRIDRLTNTTGLEKERIDYSQFDVTVSERKFIDWDGVGENWKTVLERFVHTVNGFAQDLTVGLVAFILMIVKLIVFISVSILVAVATAKFLWIAIAKIWKK